MTKDIKILLGISFMLSILFIIIMVNTVSFGKRCQQYYEDKGVAYHDCVERLSSGEKMSEILDDK